MKLLSILLLLNILITYFVMNLINYSSHPSPYKSGINKDLKYVQTNVSHNSLLKWLYKDMAIHITYEDECGDRFDLTENMSGYRKKCYQIGYDMTEYKTNAVLIEGNNRKRHLLIYNHGHSGIPGEKDYFAWDLILKSLSAGSDILLVSMPNTGVDKIKSIIKTKTWDGWSEYDPIQMEGNFPALHGMFELFDTGQSHYMRFFLDSAVVSVTKIMSEYDRIDYVGLSGGATTGLYVCNLLMDIIDNCFLVAGVMPLNYRLTPKTFGDAEQISSSFHGRIKSFDLIEQISKSKTNLYLLYNSHDTCCFDQESADKLRLDIDTIGLNVNFKIRSSYEHGFDSDEILGLIH